MAENANLLDLTDDEDFVEVINMLRNVRRRPQNYRPREDHFLSWNEEDFIKRFRLSKNGVRYIVNLISDNIRSPTQQNHALSPEQMVLLTLRFYATGNFLQTAGDLIGIDKGTASRIIWKVTQAIAGLYRHGYAVKKYLITPLAEPITRAEQLFNESQIRTRNCIERKFGQWKRRFPILAFGIRLKLEKDEAVVIATAVLENIAKLLNEQDPPFDEEEEVAVNFVNDVNIQPYMNIYNVNNVNAI
ncbi:hypothetical protein NQ315_006559, partial [Exocentrus adspersus]